ncbi:MAG: tetraacyldisaccharide 4'-kinase [Rikenellaceae bacterium]|nr:tetraacyldisaccharide 4'-kinase [Rikenellaceae bacterium]
MLKKIFTAPISWIYGWAISIRHLLFDIGVLKSVEFDIPVICVGNITVGGTGKTPHTEYIIRHLEPHFNIAVLSRGYKRRTKGFVLSTERSTVSEIGDEPKLLKLKFPHIPVAVCESRVTGVEMIRHAHPEVDMIILDDGFQHRYIKPRVSIVLMDYSRPIYRDSLLPSGRLRDLKSSIERAHMVIVTKCPPQTKPIDMRIVSKHLDIRPFQSLFFTTMTPAEPIPLYEGIGAPLANGHDVVVMTAIANPAHMVRQTKERFNVIDTLIYPDHYAYRNKDIAAMEAAVAKGDDNTVIIITEKDAVKLSAPEKIPENIRKRLYYMPISVEFMTDFRHNNPKLFFEALNKYINKITY